MITTDGTVTEGTVLPNLSTSGLAQLPDGRLVTMSRPYDGPLFQSPASLSVFDESGNITTLATSPEIDPCEILGVLPGSGHIVLMLNDLVRPQDFQFSYVVVDPSGQQTPVLARDRAGRLVRAVAAGISHDGHLYAFAYRLNARLRYTAADLVRFRDPAAIEQNLPPIARDDYVAAPAASTTTGAVLKLKPLVNDQDADRDPLTIVSVQNAPEVTATISTNGREIELEYPPGSDPATKLTYTISDNRGGTATATIFVSSPQAGGYYRALLAMDDTPAPYSAIGLATISVSRSESSPARFGSRATPSF